MSPSQQESAALGWKEYLGNEVVRAVLVVTKDRTYVPSWAHYLTAEGDATEVAIHFTNCVVRIKGAGLDRLLRKLTTQRISELFIPKRSDRLRQSDDTPGITDLAVEAKNKK